MTKLVRKLTFFFLNAFTIKVVMQEQFRFKCSSSFLPTEMQTSANVSVPYSGLVDSVCNFPAYVCKCSDNFAADAVDQ